MKVRRCTARCAPGYAPVDPRPVCVSGEPLGLACRSASLPEVREALDVDMRPASELPLEPPVVLERKALNQLDKRAKTRKLAGPKEAKDDEEHRENKQQRELRNAQTKARNQKRAKARAHKLAA